MTSQSQRTKTEKQKTIDNSKKGQTQPKTEEKENRI
jgi:hypothetical protein